MAGISFLERAFAKGYKSNPNITLWTTIVSCQDSSRSQSKTSKDSWTVGHGSWTWLINIFRHLNITWVYPRHEQEIDRALRWYDVCLFGHCLEGLRIYASHVHQGDEKSRGISQNRSKWLNTFTEAWKMLHEPIPPGTIGTVTLVRFSLWLYLSKLTLRHTFYFYLLPLSSALDLTCCNP